MNKAKRKQIAYSLVIHKQFFIVVIEISCFLKIHIFPRKHVCRGLFLNRVWICATA